MTWFLSFLGINDSGVAEGCNFRHKQWRRLYFYKTGGKSRRWEGERTWSRYEGLHIGVGGEAWLIRGGDGAGV
jgi:hypothetical protein